MISSVEYNKREIEDALNRLVDGGLDHEDRYKCADYVIENVIEIIESLGARNEDSVIIDIEVKDGSKHIQE